MNQFVDQAKDAADAYVRSQLRWAKELLRQGRTYDAYYEFGKALHTLQDATSPAHGGFQPWSDEPGFLNAVWHGLKAAWHVDKEIEYPGINSHLQGVTNYFLDWFEHSNAPLPTGNLFNGIEADGSGSGPHSGGRWPQPPKY